MWRVGYSMRKEQCEKTLRLEIFFWIWGIQTYFGRKNPFRRVAKRPENKTGEIPRGYVTHDFLSFANRISTSTLFIYEPLMGLSHERQVVDFEFQTYRPVWQHFARWIERCRIDARHHSGCQHSLGRDKSYTTVTHPTSKYVSSYVLSSRNKIMSRINRKASHRTLPLSWDQKNE